MTSSAIAPPLDALVKRTRGLRCAKSPCPRCTEARKPTLIASMSARRGIRQHHYQWAVGQLHSVEVALRLRCALSKAPGYANSVVARESKSDEQLLVDHLAGDGEAFSIIVERNAPLVWSVALKVTGNPTDASDAYQDAFLSAHRSAAKFRGDAAVSTWLYRITVNAALAQMRKSTSLGKTQQVEWEVSTRISDPSPKLHPDNVEVSIDVSQALSRLPKDQQRAVVLVDMFGYSQVDAAVALEVPEGTIKSRLFRARKALALDLAHLKPLIRLELRESGSRE